MSDLADDLIELRLAVKVFCDITSQAHILEDVCDGVIQELEGSTVLRTPEGVAVVDSVTVTDRWRA